jgi:hypothetical protein
MVEAVELTLIPGLDINLAILIFICLATGILSGFAGVGGAFILMPALIILGFPAQLAVGTSLTWIVGNSLIGLIRHHKLGNVDLRLGLILIAAALSGVELGTRLVNRAVVLGLGDEVVLIITLVLQLIVGLYVLEDCYRNMKQLDYMLNKIATIPADLKSTDISQKLQDINLPPRIHFPQAGMSMSLWIILAVGFVGGMIVGAIGVGGGFVMVPAMIYVIGVNSFVAVGTSLFQVIFSSGYGAIRQAMNSNVIIFASIIMLIVSSIGVQLGVLINRYVNGISVRLILGSSIVVSAIGVAFKLLDTLLKQALSEFNIVSTVITFGGIGLIVIVLIVLFIMARRYQKGQHVPVSIILLVSKTLE